MPSPEILCRVKTVVRTSLKIGDEVHLGDDMPLAGGEYDFDSLDILLIVTGIEKEFGIKVNDTSLNKSAFASVASLAAFVESCAPISPARSDATVAAR